MNIGDFLHSKRWKLMQNYIYSWGASVVLIGALFKLEHLPGASVFLGVGLSIEAIIFFISAFEPLMELPDWKVVYPQLRTGEEKDRELKRYEIQDKKYDHFFGSGGSGGGTSIAGLPQEQINSLKESFEQLNNTAKGLKNISDASAASESFVRNINEASSSIGAVVDANKKVSAVMEESVNEIAGSYSSTAQELKSSFAKASQGIDHTIGQMTSTLEGATRGIKESGEKAARSLESSGLGFAEKIDQSAAQLNTSYGELSATLSKGFKGIEKTSGDYGTQLEQLNKNLAAINAAYELQLKGSGKVEQMMNEYSKGVDEVGKLLVTSVEEARKFNQNTKEINQNIQALNDIYGKMLGALNGKR
jgi:gliding motility-associated protein GldL